MKFLLDQGLKGDGVARIIAQVVEATEDDLVAGAAVTVTERRLALRRLPLVTEENDEANGS